MATELSGGQKLEWKIDKEEEASLAVWLDEMEKLDVRSNETVDGDDDDHNDYSEVGYMRAVDESLEKKEHYEKALLRLCAEEDEMPEDGEIAELVAAMRQV